MKNILDAPDRENRLCFGIIGGDKRYEYLARLLQKDGHTIYAYGWPDTELSVDKALSADIVILPMPLTRDGENINLPGICLPLADIFNRLRRGQMVMAGQIPGKWRQAAEEKGIFLTDMLQRESMAIANAAATADAALSLTVQITAQTLTGKRCFVLGFGRIGKLLCHRLHGAGAVVTAAARKSADRAWIRAYGYHALDINNINALNTPDDNNKPDQFASFDMIYNTVPAPVLDRAWLTRIGPSCFFMELASRPGMDDDTAEKAAEILGPRLIHAAGLPGRVVPQSAAAILRDTVYEILREGGIL